MVVQSYNGDMLGNTHRCFGTSHCERHFRGCPMQSHLARTCKTHRNRRTRTRTCRACCLQIRTGCHFPPPYSLDPTASPHCHHRACSCEGRLSLCCTNSCSQLLAKRSPARTSSSTDCAGRAFFSNLTFLLCIMRLSWQMTVMIHEKY